ncbi:multidrug effflux MFS transporter (plasmid) [Agrobacterium tumefaciens]|uniref:multidrug effflux MFS transporter n=1 Tax=Agrobacterium tumefaciens TaxID=358 RepID=UPI000E0BE3FF|nr:multidrug effflux MFS transporter [Agrobacterium tumefaciens]WQE43618.1 multidrug effflux MFS transporter [Agrobacterium tumefaciens]
MNETSTRRLVPILGLLGAIGPLSIDMYLPGMPQIAYSLNIGEGAVQFSLMTFFAGLMIGQLFFGPLSDALGRKSMICAGLSVFIVASVGCGLADTAMQFCLWRFLQGLGGSVGFVIGLAIVRDLFSGRAAAGLISLVMIVQGVAPVVAPMLGTAIIAVAPWPMIFLALAVFGTVCLFLVCLKLPETRAADFRGGRRPMKAVRTYGTLLVDRQFLPYACVLSFAMAGFFAYLAGSSFVFISIHELSPTMFSVLFGINAVGLMVGAQIAPRLMTMYAPQRIIQVALAFYTSAAIAVTAIDFVSGADVILTAASLFIVIASMAFVMPLASALTLESFGAISGTASALLGAMNFAAGTVATLFVAVFADGTARPMMTTITVCGIAASAAAMYAFPKRQVPRASQSD